VGERSVGSLIFAIRSPLSAFRDFMIDSQPVSHIVCVTQCMAPGKHPPANDGVFENLRLELRRGCLTVAVLAELRAEQYGYTLRKALAEHGLEIDEGTLYPLLRRLESQGLLASEWREHEKRTKRFYRLSAEGARTLQHLLQELEQINTALTNIVPAGRGRRAV
jgi:PadR family transcriptional regulator PadR